MAWKKNKIQFSEVIKKIKSQINLGPQKLRVLGLKIKLAYFFATKIYMSMQVCFNFVGWP